jgi:uncharacterized protein YdeI (YjbR/CyaY-like superfamily)
MKSSPTELAGLPILPFKTQKTWATWLNRNYAKSTGLWLKLAKKESGIESVTYLEAVEAALCYGWIDGLKKSFDENSWLQKFTPRRPQSIWSKINRDKALALIKSGQMKPAGLKAIQIAKHTGRWETAYDSHRIAAVPDDLQAALDRSPKAKAFFATLKGNNRYAILFRIQTAKKADTRAKRIEKFIEMLEKKEVIYP